MFRTYIQVVCALFIILIIPTWGWCVPPGTVISNTAQVTYDADTATGIVLPSNTVISVTEIIRTPSALEYLQYAPASSGAELVTVPITECSTSGTDAGPFVQMPPPTPIGSSVPINLSNPVPLLPSNLLHQGEPVFLRLTDPDQNFEPLVAETVMVAVSVGLLGEKELLRLKETDLNTGVFAGYIQSAGNPPPATANDSILSVVEACEVISDYVDVADGGDSTSSTVLVDPFGIVFSSATGLGVDGTSITLVNTDTGLPAAVLGDDGVSDFPSTVTSGGTVTDSGGKTYNFPPGGYRFPFTAPGNYRLDVTPPAGYDAPSTVSTAILQSLPDGPFAIVNPGSRSEPFILNSGPAFHLDIPIDPIDSALWLRKTANKDIVAKGDFLQYNVYIENATEGQAFDVVVTDRLPLGFRYQPGSAKTDGMPFTDPVISSDGRSLEFNLGALGADTHVNIRYVVEVAAGARPGKATNRAFAAGAGGLTSNVAGATVEVKEDLFRSRSFIVGRVIADNCDDIPTEKDDGVEGVRIYLEDGTYVVTDKQGMFHFEGVRPGVHVVQLDLDSLPDKYEVVPCEKNSRFAGRSYSQFVDLQGGTLWRTDFHVALKPRMKGKVSLHFQSSVENDTVAYHVSLENGVVPIRNLRLSIMLPENITYVSESSRLDNTPLSDPEVNGNVLTYRLGDVPGENKRALLFKGEVSMKDEIGELITKCMLMFDTPTHNNQRTPLAENRLLLKSEEEESGHSNSILRPQFGTFGEQPGKEDGLMIEAEGTVVAETTGLLPGEQWKAAEVETQEHMTLQNYDKTRVESARPGLELLWPKPGYFPSLPSLKLAFKHDPKDTLKLLLDGSEVSPLNFDSIRQNKSGTVAVSRWTGVDLHEGDNHFEIIVYDTSGNTTGGLKHIVHYPGPPVHAEWVKEQSSLVADGRNTPVIAIRLTDKDGYPVREGTIGNFSVDSPYAAEQELDALQKNPLSGLDKDKPHYVVGKDGIARVKLQATSRSGEVVLKLDLADDEKELRLWLQPEERDWILVGLAEGTMGYNTVTGHMENASEADVDDMLYEEGRIALFAKGRIKGKWLLTMAYDNKKTNEEVGDGLYQTIDPDTYYTLYGDATEQKYDAASAGNLYVKIERDQFYALFGDYDTGLTVTELSRYSRSLNGFKSELKTKDYSFNLFVSETDQAFMKDEIRGDGTSGRYHLSRKNIVINSEKIVIETRDRFRSEVIISSQTLTRHIDYNIDYDAGTLFFREPIYSKDENFNPVFIVVDYETTDAANEEYTYGGRGAVKLLDEKLEIGATYIHEGQTGAGGDLGGVDATLDIGKHTQLKVEAATSETEDQGAEIKGDAYLVDLTHQSGDFKGQLYVREQGNGFGLGQQNGSEAGTRKIGADAIYRFNKEFSTRGQAYRQFNLATDAERDLGEATVNYTNGRSSLHAGLRHAEDRFVDGLVNRSDQVTAGASHRMFDDRLRLRLDRDQSLGNNNDNSDFPTRTIMGADYKLTESVMLFGEQEFTQGNNEDTQGTRLGMKATPWSGGQVNTSVEQEFMEYGPRVFANLGLRQSWNLNEKWGMDAGLDHSRTLKKPGNIPFNVNVPPSSGSDNDFTAVSMGTTYKEKNWSWTSRVEFRYAENEDKWGIATGIYGEPVHGVGVSAGVQIFKTDADSGADNTDADIRLGLAYRPKNSRWIVLDRLDFKFNEQENSNSNFENRHIVNNMNANFKPDHKTQIALQYGLKYVQDTIDGDDYSGFTDLIGLEARYDLNEHWDVGIRGNVLHSWSADQYDYSTGVSLGYNIFDNAWICAGYNFIGFEDQDFSRGSFTAQGPFLNFRLKLDQQSVRNALKILENK